MSLEKTPAERKARLAAIWGEPGEGLPLQDRRRLTGGKLTKHVTGDGITFYTKEQPKGHM